MTREFKSPLAINIDDVPETVLVPAKYLAGGSVGAKIAYGKESSLMVATRQPGYHSKPHKHDSEQMNYMLAGEAYVFIGDEVVHARQGDIVRIPRNVIHWSWVQGTEPCTMIEMHTPSLVGDPGVLDTAVSLLGDDEKDDEISYVGSEYLMDFDPAPYEAKLNNRK